MSEPMSPFWGTAEPSRGPRWIERLLGWLGPRRGVLLAAAGAFQVVVLLGMTVLHGMPLVLGETVLLEVRPIDPRDWFRGDYVILSYDMNRVPPGGIEGIPESKDTSYGNPPRLPEEEAIYVSLEPASNGETYSAGKMSIHRPATGKYIRGTYHRNPYGPGRIEFSGIQSFYVPEGTGKAYEDAARIGHLRAEIALTASGKAALRRLHIREK